MRAGRGLHRALGFSLVELLVVIGIIGVLLALLFPVISSVRRAAAATKCLANLQQWTQAYQAYLNTNNGRSFTFGDVPSRMDQGPNPLMWWELLRPTIITSPAEAETLLCPVATDVSNMTPHNAFEAWGPDRFWADKGVLRGSYVGSYGFNWWLYHPRPKDIGEEPLPFLKLPTKQSDQVPVAFDAARSEVNPSDTDPPRLYGTPGSNGGMRWVSMERHKNGVNVGFLDGHAEYVPAAGLWKLKWSDDFKPRDVTIQK